MNISQLLLLSFLLCLLSCRSQEQKIAAIDLPLTFLRLDNDLYRLRHDSACTTLPYLREKYGSFFEYYNTGVIHIGQSQNPRYCQILQQFLHHPIVDSAYRKVHELYADDQPLINELTDAFRHLAYYFPDIPTPNIYTYVSGFNESLMLTDSALGIGLDQFLGNDCPLYSLLGKPAYLQYNMRPQRIVPACLHTWIAAQYPNPSQNQPTLLSQLIYEGKILYILQQCMPRKPFADILGFRPEQLQWCFDNEQLIWQYLIQEKRLFDTTPFTIQKYTADAPFTTGLPPQSPGKTANWIGYRIVARYMKQHTPSLPKLMQNDNPRLLLKEARYNP
ncbi:MAG: hypothetical protein LBD91_06710 [Prevotellaceae bacterium]|jgi:hypothetical protein|nr:hypothetical protein [Prevotellaceae bacterium]